MKEFNRFDKENLSLYNDMVYKVTNADNAVDVGLSYRINDEYETLSVK